MALTSRFVKGDPHKQASHERTRSHEDRQRQVHGVLTLGRNLIDSCHGRGGCCLNYCRHTRKGQRFQEGQ